MIRMVIALTDSDLAERELLFRNPAQGGVAVPIANAVEFAAFLRALPPDVGGVMFDPRAQKGEQLLGTTSLRERLLKQLEAKL